MARRSIEELVEVYGHYLKDQSWRDTLGRFQLPGFRRVKQVLRDHPGGPPSDRESQDLAAWLRDRMNPAPPGSSAQSPTDDIIQLDGRDPDPGYEYEFREDTREFVFTFPGKSGVIIRGEDAVKQMLIDYTSWDGRAHTMEQVARANGLTRKEFFGIKRALGWTKSSLPVLPHEAEEMSEDEVAEHLVMLKMRGAEIKANRQAWRHTEAEAAKWRSFEQGVLKPFHKAIQESVSGYTPLRAEVTVVPRGDMRYALVVSPTDLHVGKLHDAMNGGRESLSLHSARQRLLEAINKLLSRLICAPEVIYFTVGGDWFNIDNAHGTTTRGTPQDNAATPPAIWAEGSTLARDAIEVLRTIAPVTVVHVPGNHDSMWGRALADFLHAWYRSDEDVTVHPERSDYVVIEYGGNMLLFHHGDGVGQATALAGLMAYDFPEAWGRAKNRYAFLGHLHHTKVKRVKTKRRIRTSEVESFDIHEDRGIVCFTLPSLSGDDRYHVKHGYTSAQPALLGVCIDYDEGWVMDVRARAA